MRDRKLEQTIAAIDITLEYHGNELKFACLPAIVDYRQRLVCIKDGLDTFPNIWEDMDRDLMRECEALMEEAGDLADEAEEYLVGAKMAAARS